MRSILQTLPPMADSDYYSAPTIAKLSSEEVLQMRRLYGCGYTHRELSKKFNISIAMVGKIIRRQSWKFLPAQPWDEPGKKKLTRQEAVQIRQKYESGGITQMQLSIEYEVTFNVIKNVIYRKTFRDV
jgi:Mor family transcriptional regulator